MVGRPSGIGGQGPYSRNSAISASEITTRTVEIEMKRTKPFHIC